MRGWKLPEAKTIKNITSNKLIIFSLLFAAGYVVLSFIVFNGYTQTFDITVFKMINTLRPSKVIDLFMVFMSLYGRELIWGALGVGLFVFGGEKAKKTAITLGLLFLILAITGSIAKGVEFRPRPYDTLPNVRRLVPAELDSSFPSGHTLIVAGGSVVAWLRLRKRWAILLTIEATLVGFSRIYVGVHYPTDVVAGAAFGICGAMLLCSNYELINKIYDHLPEQLR